MPRAQEGLVDLHSHLVPGVDDGARDLPEALEAVGRLRDAGFLRLATTPHLEGSLTRHPQALEARLQEVDQEWGALKARVGEAYPEMEIFRGHEVMLDIPDPDFSDSRIRLAGGAYVLVEWPRLQVPPETPRVLDRIRGEGFRPIIAHPERYHGLDQELDLPGEWRRMGALLQVNFGSLAGRYGEAPRQRAFTFLERGWVDLMATDFHGRSHLSLHVEEARGALEDLGGGEQFSVLARVNPGRVLAGEEIIPLSALTVERGVWSRLKAALRQRRKRG